MARRRPIDSIRRVIEKSRPRPPLPHRHPRPPDVGAWVGACALALSIFALVYQTHHLRTHLRLPHPPVLAEPYAEESHPRVGGAGSRRGRASRIFRAPERLYGTTFYPSGDTHVYVPNTHLGPHVRPVAPAAIFEGDIVVTGAVYALEKDAPPAPPAQGNETASARPAPERGVYRDVHSNAAARCGPWFVGLRNKGLYVSNDNISLAEFEKLRGTCCVYPRRPECPGWEGVVLEDDDGADKDDIPEMRRRQADIYDAVSLDEARRRMDRSSYFLAPSQSLHTSGMPISVWNMSSGEVWLPQATLAIPITTADPSHSTDDVLRAEFSTPSRQKINTGIAPLGAGLLTNTGTFLLDGFVFGFMPTRLDYGAFPSDTLHRGSNCTSVLDQALQCLENADRASQCSRELYRRGPMACCGTLADANIMIHCI